MGPQRNLSRRDMLGLLGMAGTILMAPHGAYADTEGDLNDAKARLAEAQERLEEIAAEYEDVSKKQANTLDDLEEVRDQIKTVEAQITQLEVKLGKKQGDLSSNIAEEYKDGNHGVVDLILGASSVEDLMSGLYYYDKVTEEQTRLIEDVKDARAELDNKHIELEGRKVELEQVSKEQQAYLEEMRGKQLEAQELIEGLDQEVRDLIAKRDAEILAAQQEAERARKEREEAARAAKEAEETRAAQEAAAAKDEKEAAGSTEEARPAAKPAEQPAEKPVAEDTASDEGSSPATGSAAAVIAACHSTPSPGGGLCAAWCSNVLMNAGFGFVSGNANDMYAEYCYSSNRADIRPGMAVAVSTHPHTTAGRIYGHIGMYIGNGTVMDNVGYIRTISLDEWIDYYGQTVPVRWGWLGGIVLS